MNRTRLVTRKGFLQLMAGSVGLSALGVACGDDSGSGGSGGAPTTTSGGTTKSTSASTTATGTGATTSTGTGTTTSSGSSSSSSSTTTGGNLTCNSNIALNHGHMMTVSAADVMAGMQKDYDITGSALHAHTVTLTAADFQQLALGMTVTKTSSQTGHTHTVMVTCSS